jgi:Ca-activated chloride channel family protein
MSSFALAHPWLLAVLPLPLLLWWLVPPYREPHRGLVVPFLPRLADAAGEQPGHGAAVSRRGVLRALLLAFGWTCAVLALARPQVIEPPVMKDIPARDLLLAVDLSGSMETQDFKDSSGATVDRLTAVKQVLDDFLSRRQGDRVGLIFFGSAAFVQAPFTDDLAVCRELLDEAQVRMAGPQTVFGDALGLAINVFDRSTVEERVLIALTDGNDTASQVPPAKAAQIAKDKGIVIHTVAVGDPTGAGEDALDEATLQRVASTTGGLYSHAGNRDELQAIYGRLNELETRKVDTLSHRPRRDVYWWPLAAGLLVSMGYLAFGLLASSLPRRVHMSTPHATQASIAPAGLAASLGAFHFVRPAWLLLLIPALLLWWFLRRHADPARGWRRYVAPHLLERLWGGEETRRRPGPPEWLALLWLAAILAVAGPTWRHEPSPFAEETAALAVVVKVSPSMQTEDIQPSRLERATMKLHDLLQARGDAKTALIAYAGTAHRVMPPTRDGGIIDNFMGALTPEIMPRDGDAAAAALALADESLVEAGGGSILWITDSIAPEQASPLEEWRSASPTTVRLWPPLLPGDELDALEEDSRPARPAIVALAADDSDVMALASAAKFAPTVGDATDTRWAESGYLLTPLILLLMLPFFRRGWVVSMTRAG